MLLSPFVQSEPKNGVVYVTFDDNGGHQPIADIDQVSNEAKQKSLVKKEKKALEGGDLSGSDNNGEDAVVIDSDEDAREVVFAEEQEYGNDEDDFGAVNDDDD